MLKKTFCSAVFVWILAMGAVFAQTPNPPVIPKRNSPYSPNPKKKIEIATKTTPTDLPKNVESNNEVQIVKVAANVSTQDEKAQNLPEPTPQTKIEEKVGETKSQGVETKPAEILKKVNVTNASPMEIYKVGAGDVLFIGIQNAPAKKSTYFTVLKDGTIDYPLAGEMVQVLGLTPDQIEEILETKIKIYDNPQVSVKVREANSHKFTVTGLVENSGDKFMPREALPLFTVRAEANVQPKANRANIKRGNETQSIDLREAKSGDTLIFPNDIVEFTSDEIEFAKSPQFYYIGGEIISGGKKDFTSGITLTQAIIESGGLKRTNVRKVVIRRKNEAGLLIPSEFDLKSIKDGKIADPILQIGDTIEVGN